MVARLGYRLSGSMCGLVMYAATQLLKRSRPKARYGRQYASRELGEAGTGQSKERTPCGLSAREWPFNRRVEVELVACWSVHQRMEAPQVGG